MLRFSWVCLWLFYCCVMLSRVAWAADVVIDTDFQSGRGILRAVGKACFVYTPNHVVENTDGIYVSSQYLKDVEASLLASYPQDLALLRLPNQQAEMCQQSSWNDGGKRVEAVISASHEAVLSLRKKNGSLTDYALTIVSKDLHTYFYVQLKDDNKQIVKGMSGSIVYVGSYPLGMLVSINHGIGKVIRMDTLADISQSVINHYVSTFELVTEQPNNLKALTQAGFDAAIVAQRKFKGAVALGESKDFKVVVTGHSAFKLSSINGGQKFSSEVEIQWIAPDGKVMKSHQLKIANRDHQLGFGAIMQGEYTLRVIGSSEGQNSFDFNWQIIATPMQLTGQANWLSSGDVIKGYLAVGTFADYRIKVLGNSAFTMTSKQQIHNMFIEVQLIAPNGQVLKANELNTAQQDHQFGFGMVDEGEYILRLVAKGGEFGAYYFTWQQIASVSQLIGQTNILIDDKRIKGNLSQGTYAEYRFRATGNTAYRLKSRKQSQNILVRIQLRASDGKLLKKNQLQTGRRDRQLGYGVVDEGEYILRIWGADKEFGTYDFTWHEIATPEQLIGQANVFAYGDIAKGYVAKGTFADYKVKITNHQSFHLSSKKQSQNVYVEVQLLSSNGYLLKNYQFQTGKADHQFDLGIVEQGEHTLRIKGIGKEFGTFNFTWIDNKAQRLF